MNTNYPIKGVHEGIPYQVDLNIRFNISEYDPCTTCNGRGTITPHHGGIGGFGNAFDDTELVPYKCSVCDGSGRKRWWKNEPDWWQDFPILARDIRDAWHREWNRQQNDEFKLEPSPKDK